MGKARIELSKLVTQVSPASVDKRREIWEPVNGEFAAMRVSLFFFSEAIPVGNHVHLWQEEIFFVISGGIRIIFLEDTVTKERLILRDLGKGTRIHLPASIGHALIFEPGSTMAALSSKPFDEHDLFPYKIMGPNGEEVQP